MEMEDERTENSESEANNSMSNVAHTVASRPTFRVIVVNNSSAALTQRELNGSYHEDDVDCSFADRAGGEESQDSDSDCFVVAKVDR